VLLSITALAYKGSEVLIWPAKARERAGVKLFLSILGLRFLEEEVENGDSQIFQSRPPTSC
jgi:hypothetical protein